MRLVRVSSKEILSIVGLDPFNLIIFAPVDRFDSAAVDFGHWNILLIAALIVCVSIGARNLKGTACLLGNRGTSQLLKLPMIRSLAHDGLQLCV